MNHIVTVVIAKAALGAGLALGFATMPHALAHTDTVAGYDAYPRRSAMTMRTASSKKTRAVGIAHRHRNRICGVGNAQGAIPGDWTTTDADGNPVAPHASGPYAWDGRTTSADTTDRSLSSPREPDLL